MVDLLKFLKYWLIPRKTNDVHIDPQGRGLRIGSDESLLEWGGVKELRQDFWLGRLDVLNKWQMGEIIVTSDGKEIYTNVLPDSLRKTIIDKADLKLKKISFWFSQKIYSK